MFRWSRVALMAASWSAVFDFCSSDSSLRTWKMMRLMATSRPRQVPCVHVGVCVCVCERERESVCVSVCVRKSVCECVCMCV
jgi:hypothetical protein